MGATQNLIILFETKTGIRTQSTSWGLKKRRFCRALTLSSISLMAYLRFQGYIYMYSHLKFKLYVSFKYTRLMHVEAY